MRTSVAWAGAVLGVLVAATACSGSVPSASSAVDGG
jgi:hypothetical protein